MEGVNEKKIILKTLISDLDISTKKLKYRCYVLRCVVSFHIVLLAIYSALIISAYLYVPNVYFALIFEVLNIVFFLSLMAYSSFQKGKILSLWKEQCDGIKRLDKLANYVDWKGYRRVQLYNDTDIEVSRSITSFFKVYNSAFCNKITFKRTFHVIDICFTAIRCIILIFGITYMLRYMNELSDIISLTKLDVSVFLVVGFVLLGIATICIFIYIVKHQNNVVEAHNEMLYKYIVKLTHFCSFINVYSKCISYNNLDDNYTNQIKILFERFITFGNENTLTNNGLAGSSIGMNKMYGLSENITHLFFYVKDAVRSNDNILTFDDKSAQLYKEDILTEAANISVSYAGLKVNWNLLLRIADDLYKNDWTKIKLHRKSYINRMTKVKYVKIITLNTAIMYFLFALVLILSLNKINVWLVAICGIMSAFAFIPVVTHVIKTKRVLEEMQYEIMKLQQELNAN